MAASDEADDSASEDTPAADAGTSKDAGKSASSSSSSASSATNKDAGKAASSGSTGSSSASTTKDAGKASSSSSSGSNSSNVTVNGVDAGNPLDALTGLLGGSGSTSGDGGTKPSSSAGDGGADHCGPDLFCFDIFDCAIFHPDALDCGFTKCEGFVCKM